MKNITVSVDEETHRLARIRAAELDTSVSALVRDYLKALAGARSPQDDASDRAAIRLNVEQLYEEARARAEALSGQRIRDESELHEESVRSLHEVLADFDARGVGVDPRTFLTREEMYAEAIDGSHEVH